LPAAYGVGTLCHIFTYTGTVPFTGGALTQQPSTWPPVQWRATENWSAFVDGSNFGIGVHNPDVISTGGGYLNAAPCTGGSADNNTAYIAPSTLEVLDYNIVYEYDFNLIVGTLTGIRDWVYTHHSDPRPDYSFRNSRRHWYANYGDAGPPAGFLRQYLNGPDPILTGPYCAFPASTCPKIYFAARYVMSSPPADAIAQLFWQTNNSGDFSEALSEIVTVIPDGKWRIYSFNVGANAAWSGLISQLRFDAIQSGGTGDYVDIAGISYQNDFLLPTGTPRAAVIDFNGDGHPDWVVRNAGTRQTAIWYLNNSVFVSAAWGPTLPAGWSLLGIADFNRDGRPDYALFNSTTRQTAIWYLSRPTFLRAAYGPSVPSGWALVAMADFNGNGYPDYMLYKASTGQTAIWYLNNNVFVSAAYGPTLPAGWSLVAP
jgi:hypothetical protein